MADKNSLERGDWAAVDEVVLDHIGPKAVQVLQPLQEALRSSMPVYRHRCFPVGGGSSQNWSYHVLCRCRHEGLREVGEWVRHEKTAIALQHQSSDQPLRNLKAWSLTFKCAQTHL